MRKMFLPAMLGASMMLGGCTQLGGLGGLLGGGNDYGYGYGDRNDFQRAAVSACGREAERYGRVQITYAEERTRGIYTVQGRIESRDSRTDQFTCQFDDSGRIRDFRLG